MTAIPKSAEWITPEEYLAGELQAEVRHEYVDGCVYAVAGASVDHNRIAGNIFSLLHNALKEKRCEPFYSDMKVKIPPAFGDVFYYPDVMVACDPSDGAEHYVERPSIIFEVISPSTERIDRREKVLTYRQIPSLDVYVLVDQDCVRTTVLRRAEPGWKTEVVEGLAGVLHLPTISVDLPLSAVYDRTAALGRG